MGMLCSLGTCSNAAVPIAIQDACAVGTRSTLFPSQAVMAAIGAATMLWGCIAAAGRSGGASSGSSCSLAKLRDRRSLWLSRIEASWAGKGSALTLTVHRPLAVVASTTCQAPALRLPSYIDLLTPLCSTSRALLSASDTAAQPLQLCTYLWQCVTAVS